MCHAWIKTHVPFLASQLGSSSKCRAKLARQGTNYEMWPFVTNWRLQTVTKWDHLVWAGRLGVSLGAAAAPLLEYHNNEWSLYLGQFLANIAYINSGSPPPVHMGPDFGIIIKVTTIRVIQSFTDHFYIKIKLIVCKYCKKQPLSCLSSPLFFTNFAWPKIIILQ